MKVAATHVAPEFLAMSEEEQEFLDGLASVIVGTLESAEKEIAEQYANLSLDLEEQVALWAILPSRVRTAIKRASAAPGVLCNECGLTGAHTRHCPIGGKFA